MWSVAITLILEGFRSQISKSVQNGLIFACTFKPKLPRSVKIRVIVTLHLEQQLEGHEPDLARGRGTQRFPDDEVEVQL